MHWQVRFICQTLKFLMLLTALGSQWLSVHLSFKFLLNISMYNPFYVFVTSGSTLVTLLFFINYLTAKCTLGHWRGYSVTHSTLITAHYQFQSKGHQEPNTEVDKLPIGSRGVFRCNERQCMVWVTKLGLGQKNSTINVFYVICYHLVNFQVFTW